MPRKNEIKNKKEHKCQNKMDERVREKGKRGKNREEKHGYFDYIAIILDYSNRKLNN